VSADGSGSPLVVIEGLVKAFAATPLRVQRLSLTAVDRVVLAGLGPESAEMLVHLITGAAVPDEGTIRIDGRDTREIGSDSEWLRSLDQFGLVSDRALLIDALTIEANMALPLTVSIDPIADSVRARIRELAADVDLDPARLSERAATLSPEERARVHLARALAPGPRLLLLEHPTRGIGGPAAAIAFGGLLSRVSTTRSVGWLAMSDDAAFARASEGRRLRLDPAHGAIRPERSPWLRRLFSRTRP